ncbi:MAG: enoyl-CoA hydratase-related protein [Chloroflexota bacterium]
MTENPVLYERQGRVALITLNRPRVINAFNRAMYVGFNEAIERFGKDEDVWVAIVNGAGPRGFCSGVDIKAASAELAADVTEPLPPLTICQEMVTSKPIVAAVHGHCVGEGVNLILSCDMVFAEVSSNFFVSEARVGVNAVDIPLKLSRKMGYFTAFEMLMGLEGKSAKWCRQAGLVNQVVEDGTVTEAALHWANRLIDETAPLPIRAMKETLWRAALEDEAKGREAGMAWRQTIGQSADWNEGRAAFIEKRKPRYEGK